MGIDAKSKMAHDFKTAMLASYGDEIDHKCEDFSRSKDWHAEQYQEQNIR